MKKTKKQKKRGSDPIYLLCLRYATLLWTLLTPSTILSIGLDRILSHPVSNSSKSQKIVITSSTSGVEMQKL